MVSQCANPACATPLRYLRDGRLFQFEVRALDGTAREGSNPLLGQRKRPLRQVWHYWLCGLCSATMTLEFDQLKGLQLTPLGHECSRLAS